MSNYQHSKDLEGQVLTLIEAIVPSQEQATAAKSIFRRLFHEWSMGIDVGEIRGSLYSAEPCTHTAEHPGENCASYDQKKEV